MISQHEIDRIRQNTSMLALCRSYGIHPVKAGQEYRALCPFHIENTPSFFINEQSGLYHCHGCDRGGDVFSFVMEKENTDFPGAFAIFSNG